MSRPPVAVRAGSLWRPGGGDGGAAVSQCLGPTAALTCSAPKPFGAVPGDGRRTRRGLPPSLLTLVCVTCWRIGEVLGRGVRGEEGLPTFTG